MESKLSESPVKNSLIKKLSPNHSLSNEKNLFTKSFQQFSKPTKNGFYAHLNELSVKIQGVQKRLKNQETGNPLLRQSNKVTKAVDLMSKYKTNSKTAFMSGQQARSSWDNTVQLNFLKDPKEEKDTNNEETNNRMSFDVGMDLSSKNKLNQLMKSKFTGSTVGAINKTLGGQKDGSKHVFSVSQVTQNDAANIQNEKRKVTDQNSKNEKVKNRIEKSMQMLDFLKNQDYNKTKKERTKKQEEKKQSEIVNGFQLGRMLGKGKFGQVYLSKHLATGFVVAIKKILKKKLVEYNIVEQFIKEIKLHSALDHPKIVKFFGFFEEKDSFYFILEYMNGGTLFDYLNIVKTLKIKETVEFLKDIIQAVSQMHNRSIAHRDIKPENIVINTEGVAKICDFGWAALVDKSRTTYCGTLEYVSPQILQRKGYDQSVDIWSLGILTYQMLMGRAPFENCDRSIMKEKIMNMNLEELPYSRNVPMEAKNFIQWLVQKDPQKRPKVTELTSHEMFTKYGSSKNSRKILQ